MTRGQPARRRDSRGAWADCCDALEPRVLLAASLLRDINTTSPASNPHSFVDLNGALLFRANDGVHGDDWWRSDGTAGGTQLVKDLNAAGPPPPAGLALPPRSHAVLGGSLLFADSEAGTGIELWKTDGTAAGTVLVKDIVPGPDSSSPAWFVAAGDTLYFAAGAQLWKTDGTGAGTVAVATDFRGPPHPLGVLGGRLFFQAAGPAGGANIGNELWATDGTAAGTVLVKDIQPGTSGSNPGYQSFSNVQDDDYPADRFLVAGDVAYFPATTAAQGRELWQTDGTPGGTRIAADAVPSTSGSGSSSPGFLAEWGGSVYYTGRDGSNARPVLYRFDPGNPTAFVVHRANFGSALGLGVSGDSLYYVANTPLPSPPPGGPVSGPAAYRVNDDGAGVTELARPDRFYRAAPSFVRAGETTYFGFGSGITPSFPTFELWRTDGTRAGTSRVGAWSGVTSSGQPELVAVGETLYFAGSDGIGSEPWRSDGTPAGTGPLFDVNAMVTYDASPTRPVAVNGRWLFSAEDGVHGRELWVTDGTAAGTRRVTDPTTGNGFGVATDLYKTLVNAYRAYSFGTEWNGRLYFGGRSSDADGYQLYSSDGTGEGTTFLRALSADNGGSYPREFTPFKGRLYFIADDVLAGKRTLYVTDGTSAGTVPVKDFSGVFSSIPAAFTVIGDTMYFTANGGGYGFEVWKTDGTAEGTVLVKDVNPLGDASPRWLTAYNGQLYFAADHAQYGRELWRTDGTEAGTVLVKDLDPTSDLYDGVMTPNGGYPVNLRVVNGRLLFEGSDRSYPYRVRIWASDGTAAGTEPITPDDFPTPFISLHLIEAGGVGYFINSGITKPELWRTDGTSGGTRRVTVFESAGSYPTAVPVGVNGPVLYLRVTDDGPGGFPPAGPVELWQSDGTEAGTQRLFSGSRFAKPDNTVALADGRVLFSGNDDVHGNELMLAAPAPVARVVGRHVFYNNSASDGNDAAPNAADDNAVATDKFALLPGQGPARFANVTSYSRGINGIMIDVSGGLPLTALAGIGGGVGLKVGTGGDPAGWAEAPRPSRLTIRQGAGVGGSDRITLVWPDGAIRKTWLRVTMNAIPQAGFDHGDVFYFGNLVGEVGDGAGLAVGAGDVVAVRGSLGRGAALNSRHDFNRDGRVNATDLALARSNVMRLLTQPTSAVAPASSSDSVPAARRASAGRSRYTGVTEILRHAAAD